MKDVRIEKLTLNIGSGKEQDKLEKAVKLLKNITGTTVVKTKSLKRIPNWGLRPGLAIGCKVTIRKEHAKELAGRLLAARDGKLELSNFDNAGNISWGIPEYIDIPQVNYDPQIGVMGLQCSLTLERRGYRVKKRVHLRRSLPIRQQVSKEDAINFMKDNFDVKIGESD